MRCLTLADALRQRGANIQFVCKQFPGNLIPVIQDRGYQVCALPPADCSARGGVGRVAAETIAALPDRPDWLVVDHYGLDADWETQVRRPGTRILVIDDLANRPHACDLLVDQNYYSRAAERYRGLLPPACRPLLGPAYALLSPEYEEAIDRPFRRIRDMERVLVFFGGSDPTQETEKLLAAIGNQALSGLMFDVVAGIGNPRREVLHAHCQAYSNVHFHCQTKKMAELCRKADLALGAGGSANWERFSFALPCLVVTTADNQRETVADLVRDGYIRGLGWHAEVTSKRLVEALHTAVAAREDMYAMGLRARDLMAGTSRKGAAFVADCMLFTGA